MKKRIIFLVSLVTILASCGNNGTTSTSTTIAPKTRKDVYKLKTDNSILSDSNYRNGFYLISPESTNQYFERILDYNGERETDFYKDNEYKTYWQMCQWWTPFNFKDATYRKDGDTHIYENESRYFGINTKTSDLRMKLDADKEYKELYPLNDGMRPNEASWSHFLIQQSFPEEVGIYPADIDEIGGELHVKFDIRIDECTYKRKDKPTGSNCAQLMFYLLIRNNVAADADFNEVGRRNTKMWFGLPIYDSRYDFVADYHAGDVGFEGATGHLIYSISSKNYFNEPIKMGKTYSVDINVLEFMKQGFVYGATAPEKFLENCKWQNMFLDYMNFGWELPGNYAVDSTITNLDIYFTE